MSWLIVAVAICRAPFRKWKSLPTVALVTVCGNTYEGVCSVEFATCMARLVKQATRNVQLASSARLVARAKPARVEADAIIVQIMLGLRQMEPSCRLFNGIYKCTVALVLTGLRLVLVKACHGSGASSIASGPLADA